MLLVAIKRGASDKEMGAEDDRNSIMDTSRKTLATLSTMESKRERRLYQKRNGSLSGAFSF